MAILVRCSFCGLTNTVDDEQAGQVVECAGCHLTLPVPGAEPELEPKDLDVYDLQPIEEEPARRAEVPIAEVYEAEVQEEPPAESCTEHRGVAMAARCGDCDRPFCANCLTSFRQQRLCAACKNKRVQKLQRPERGSTLANVALIVGLPSLLFIPLGLLFGPIALILGIMALRDVERRPGAPGRAWALSGITLGIYGVLVGFGFLMWNAVQ